MWSNVALVVIACVIVACIYIFAQPAKSKFREQFAINVEQDYRQSINKTFNKVLGRDPQEYEVQLYRDSMTSPFDTEPIEKKLQASAEFKTVVEANAFAQPFAQPFPTYPIPNPVPKPRLVDASAPFTNADEALITKATMAAAATAATSASTAAAAAASASTSANPSTNSDPKSNNDQTIASMDLGKRLELYRLIVSIYEKNLERLPSMKELNYYTVRITNDKTFNSDKLIKILQSSQEYNILQKNQTNVVNAELEGAITDAQLTLLVNDIYRSMFKNEEPSKSFEDFMKIKYVEYKLDDVKFRKMLAMLHDVDVDAVAVPPAAVCPVVIPASASNAPTPTQASTAQNPNPSQNANANASIALIPTLNGGKMSASSTQVGSANSISTPGTQQVLSNQTQSLANAANAANNVIQEAAYPSKALADSYCTTATAYNKNKVFDSLYANIQLAQQQSCTIVAPNSSTYGDRNKLAETMDDRNQSRLGYECARNSESILSAQDNARFQYSYDPNVVPLLRNTKFGTFLDDAENTSVGSIMPRFVYREYGTVL